MKFSDGFLARKIEDKYVVFPVGESVINKCNPMYVNETGYDLLKIMEEDVDFATVVEKMSIQYEVKVSEMREFEDSIRNYIDSMAKMGYII